jgi:ion channel
MEWVEKVKQTPSAALLFVQLAGVLLYPFMEATRPGRAAFSVFGVLVLALAVLAVRRTPSITWISAALAGPAVVLLVAQVFSTASWLLPWSAAFEAVLYFYAGVSLIRYMFADHAVTTDELFAVGATFTLFAWAFAYVYVVIQAATPGSFTAAVHPADSRSWVELLFLSFTTLSSTGLSDIVPIKPFARSVLMIEQLAGVLYVAMVVARIVGLTFARTGGGGSSGAPSNPSASPTGSTATTTGAAESDEQS